MRDHHAATLSKRRRRYSIPTEPFDRLAATAVVEARSRRDVFETQIDSTLVFAADQHLTYSAVPNLIQEALMFTRTGRNVEVRRNLAGEHARIEVENECGSPLSNTSDDPSGPLRTDGIPMEEPTDNSGPRLGRGFLYA